MSIYTDNFHNRIEADGWDISLFCHDAIGRRSYFKDKHDNNFGDALKWVWDDWSYWVKRKRKQ